jgi:hypothetical protein
MNGMFSNSRVLGDLAKHLFFVDYIQEHHLDFLAISKTVDEISHQFSLTAFQAA